MVTVSELDGRAALWFRRYHGRVRIGEQPEAPAREWRTTDKHIDLERMFFHARLERCVHRFLRAHIVTP